VSNYYNKTINNYYLYNRLINSERDDMRVCVCVYVFVFVINSSPFEIEKVPGFLTLVKVSGRNLDLIRTPRVKSKNSKYFFN